MSLKKWVAGFISAAVVAAAVWFMQPAHADMAPAGGTVPLQVKAGGPAGLCINLPNGNAGANVEVELWTCWGTTNTAEDVDVDPDGTLRIKDHCLQSPASGSGSPSDGVVTLQNCTTGANQKWEYRSSDQSFYNRNSNQCLSAGTSDWQMGIRSTKLRTANCASGAAQQTWSITAWGPITADDGNCFNAPNDWMGDGYPLEVYPCSNSYNHAQVWHYDRASGQILGDYNGWKNKNANLWCVTADDQNVGTVVKFRKCDSDPASNKGQVWQERSGGIFYNPVSNKCLGVKDVTSTGKPLELQECLTVQG
ncbi:ricin-type beta-trefoil lectin domain protein [Streptomyces sp. NPDC091377]|uniref:ricin-type beta-trefoil lectin domain protein n=1 Tax=Streptomyces sp. NPDC091377 TaxID=3365995 RepID=UPI00383099F4